MYLTIYRDYNYILHKSICSTNNRKICYTRTQQYEVFTEYIPPNTCPTYC